MFFIGLNNTYKNLLPITSVQVIANGTFGFNNISFIGTPMYQADYTENGFIYRIPQ
jgi:hypothetical protein